MNSGISFSVFGPMTARTEPNLNYKLGKGKKPGYDRGIKGPKT